MENRQHFATRNFVVLDLPFDTGELLTTSEPAASLPTSLFQRFILVVVTFVPNVAPSGGFEDESWFRRKDLLSAKLVFFLNFHSANFRVNCLLLGHVRSKH